MRVRQLDNNHDWTFGRGKANYLTKSEAIKQCVETKLLAFKNDWVLNRNDGIDWFSYLVKNPDLNSLKSEIKTEVFNVDGVVEISLLNVELDNTTRKINIHLVYSDKYNETSEIDNAYNI